MLLDQKCNFRVTVIDRRLENLCFRDAFDVSRESGDSVSTTLCILSSTVAENIGALATTTSPLGSPTFLAPSLLSS